MSVNFMDQEPLHMVLAIDTCSFKSISRLLYGFKIVQVAANLFART